MSVPIRAILIDMDGVLYQGEHAIPGVREALDWLKTAQIPHLFLTNTTSRPRTALVEKLARMGMEIGIDQILTPPVAATRWLIERMDGVVALFVPEATRTEFEPLKTVAPDSAEPVAAVVIGDYGEKWSYPALNKAFRWLMHDDHTLLVALGMTRYWQAEDGLRLDTAPFVTALEHATGRQAVVLGKPAAPFFEAALQKLGSTAAETLMIGDDIRSDIDGAQAVGIRGLLVKTGKFRAADLNSDIQPAAVIESFADLPRFLQSCMVV